MPGTLSVSYYCYYLPIVLIIDIQENKRNYGYVFQLQIKQLFNLLREY